MHNSANAEESIETIARERSTSENEIARRLVLLAKCMQDFQQQIILKRRRYQQRVLRRRALMRTVIYKHLMDMEKICLESLPFLGLFDIGTDMDTSRETPQEVVTTESISKKRKRKKPKDKGGFFEEADKYYSDDQWLATFRMSKNTFNWLCEQLQEMRPIVQRAPGNNLINLKKRVALVLYELATGDGYRSISECFNVSRTSVCNIIRRFAESLLGKLGTKLLTMPKRDEELKEILIGFNREANMPHACVGVLSSCELIVKAHTESDTLRLEVLIDDKLMFRKIQVNGDSPMLWKCPNDVSKLQHQFINGQEVPCFAVTAIPSYPLRPWLMRPYDCPETPQQHDFNEAVENAMELKQKAIRRLFARWSLLQRKVDLDSDTMEMIALTCCALHNLLEEIDETYLDEWESGIDLSKLNIDNIEYYDVSNRQDPLTNVSEDLRNFFASTISSTEM